MRALRYDLALPRVALSLAAGRFSDTFVFGAGSGLKLRELPELEIPGPDWVRLELIACGICGSDLAFLRFKGSIALQPFSSFPAVLGHEVLARVVELGSAVRGLEIGQRVVVDPQVTCRVRGYAESELCPSCAAGRPNTCTRSGKQGRISVAGHQLSAGRTVGFHRDLPGGWGEQMLAHQSQIFAVDDSIDDQRAALTEPLAVAVHAVLGAMPRPDQECLVIGSGPIALSTIWALRALGFEGTIVAQMKREREASLARELGVSEVIRPGTQARDRLLGTGAEAYQPTMGAEVFCGGGFELIYDCVGSQQSLNQALRYLSPRGQVVLLGCAGELGKLDFSFVWSRELSIRGFVTYGTERWQGEEKHTFALTLELLRQSELPIARMVTRELPLTSYREALSWASHRQRGGDLKVLLRNGG